MVLIIKIVWFHRHSIALENNLIKNEEKELKSEENDLQNNDLPQDEQ